jgi:hypothetical protein
MEGVKENNKEVTEDVITEKTINANSENNNLYFRIRKCGSSSHTEIFLQSGWKTLISISSWDMAKCVRIKE